MKKATEKANDKGAGAAGTSKRNLKAARGRKEVTMKAPRVYGYSGGDTQMGKRQEEQRTEGTRKPLSECSLEELLTLRAQLTGKIAGTLCTLIRAEIKADGTKKRVKAWMKSLGRVQGEMEDELIESLEQEGVDKAEAEELNKLLQEEMEEVYSEAAAFLITPKRSPQE
jgi:hypothetical protein